MDICEFEWDEKKNKINYEKHNLKFETAQNAFLDQNRIITFDIKHSTEIEKRYFCFGMVDKMIITVRFTIRDNKIRIFGAGYWREGREIYEKHNEK